ncbi:Tetracycline regulation of excision, RteC [Bacteroides helcogenes P 36-108]|uniref:Tetracycline regulation of excision, RteC n=1 Tax=Bacteroides helcogenes (strain ATCC 35417 / DSM 20613 / JCM 6297 / CCUG 15421 / P 36-108) TaxID=693979 RepID=E6SR93_BACT6|nr:Tetracycline regulation of excision, RteC [Bacteroides helcogenes P 36-108]
MKQISNNIIAKINTEITMSCIDSDISSDTALHMINFIRPLFEELRKFIHQYTFQDANEEILFFKDIKPFILSKLIYFSDIYTLELRKPNGSKEVLKEYYKRKQATITEFCNHNLDFYQYYRSKAIHLDKYYFLRGHENYKLCHNCGMLDKDPLFSTCCDHKVAKMLGYDMLEIYLQQRLQNMERQEVIETSRATLPDNPFQWTGTKIAVIELGYAIYAAGVLNNGNADIKEIMTYLEASFKIDLGDYYRTYLTMRERKKDKPHLQVVRKYNSKSVMNIGVISFIEISDRLYLLWINSARWRRVTSYLR